MIDGRMIFKRTLMTKSFKKRFRVREIRRMLDSGMIDGRMIFKKVLSTESFFKKEI